MGRKKEAPQGPAYMQLFAVLMLLLLAFFVILNTFSTQKKPGFGEHVRKVKHSFGFGRTLGFGILPLSYGPQGKQTTGKASKKAGKRGETPFPKKTKPDTSTQDDSHSTPDAQKNPPAEYYRVKIPYEFPEGDHRITDTLSEYLHRLGAAMTNTDKPVTIRSFTQEKGDPQKDRLLALRRSASIVRYLHRKARIPLSRMTSAGYAHKRYFKNDEEDQDKIPDKQATYIYILHQKSSQNAEE